MKNAGALLLWGLFGAILGNLIGLILAKLITGPLINQILTTALPLGFPVNTLDLYVVTLTLGFTIKLNLVGALGAIGTVLYVWRRR